VVVVDSDPTTTAPLLDLVMVDTVFLPVLFIHLLLVHSCLLVDLLLDVKLLMLLLDVVVSKDFTLLVDVVVVDSALEAAALHPASLTKKLLKNLQPLQLILMRTLPNLALRLLQQPQQKKHTAITVTTRLNMMVISTTISVPILKLTPSTAMPLPLTVILGLMKLRVITDSIRRIRKDQSSPLHFQIQVIFIVKLMFTLRL